MMGTFFIFMSFTAVTLSTENSSPAKWIAPDAWSRADINISPNNQNQSETYINGENVVKFVQEQIFYAKLLKFIFNRKLMVFDESANQFSRQIMFKITPEQLQILEKSIDPRDWDSVLTNILPETVSFDTPHQYGYLSNAFEYIFNIVTSSEVRFTLILLAFMMIIIYCSRRYHIGIVTTIIVGSLLFGLVHSYYECNRELAIKELFEGLQPAENPCENLGENKSFWSRIFFEDNNKQRCIDFLKQKNKIKLPYCQPMEVILKYFRELIFNQLFSIMEESADVLGKCFAYISFPYNYIAAILFLILLPQIISGAVNTMITLFVARRNFHVDPPSVHQQEKSSQDQLSGENLRLFLQQARAYSKKSTAIKSSADQKNHKFMEKVKRRKIEDNTSVRPNMKEIGDHSIEDLESTTETDFSSAEDLTST